MSVEITADKRFPPKKCVIGPEAAVGELLRLISNPQTRIAITRPMILDLDDHDCGYLLEPLNGGQSLRVIQRSSGWEVIVDLARPNLIIVRRMAEEPQILRIDAIISAWSCGGNKIKEIVLDGGASFMEYYGKA